MWCNGAVWCLTRIRGGRMVGDREKHEQEGSMNKPEHEYWAHGQSVRLCDWSTAHMVRDVAFCDTPQRAAAFAKMLNEYQVAHGMLVDN